MKRKNYTKEDYEAVADYFFENKDKTISGEKIKQLFGLTTVKLQAIIHDLRVDNKPIISLGRNGYKLTEDKDEVMKTYMSLVERAKSILVAANGLKDYMEHQE